MEWLRIEMLGEIDDTLFGHLKRAGSKSISHVQILQVSLSHIASLSDCSGGRRADRQTEDPAYMKSFVVMLSEVKASQYDFPLAHQEILRLRFAFAKRSLS
jgi:hypothetical protein